MEGLGAVDCQEYVQRDSDVLATLGWGLQGQSLIVLGSNPEGLLEREPLPLHRVLCEGGLLELMAGDQQQALILGQEYLISVVIVVSINFAIFYCQMSCFVAGFKLDAGVGKVAPGHCWA